MESVSFARIDFNVARRALYPLAGAHRHTDIEVLLTERGESEHEFGGARFTCRPGELVLFWAGVPHRCVRATPGGLCYLVHLPLPWALSWSLPGPLVSQLLRGQWFSSDAADLAEAWRERMREWCQSDGRAGRDGERCTLLEMEALLRRLCRDQPPAPPPRPENRGGAGALDATEHTTAHRVALFVTENYGRRLSSREVGTAVGVHPNHAMRAFSAAYGMSLWTYIGRLRLAHAQYLLRHSCLSVVEIAYASGFTSVGRFYTTFRREAGATPGEYRRESAAPPRAGSASDHLA